MKTIHKRFILILLAASLLAVVGTGCNTAHGFGKDVSNTGDAIQRNTPSSPANLRMTFYAGTIQLGRKAYAPSI
jgi:predicted small secreted protein